MRMLLVCAAALLAAPAAADAATKWPSESQYVAGSATTVRVDNKQATPVVFARVSSRGKVLRVLKRTSVRRGAVELEFGGPGQYSLRVGNRTRRYVAVDGCLRVAEDGDRTEIRLLTPVVPVGGTVRYKLVNTSANRGCLLAGAGYGLERLQPDGAWANIPIRLPFPAIGLRLTPWRALEKTAPLPPDVNAPGVFRIVDSVFTRAGTEAPGTPTRTITAVAQFEVR